MLIRTSCFNIYLASALVLTLLCGCKSPEERAAKKPGFFRVHMEATPMIAKRTQTVTVFRQAPTNIEVEPVPFVTEEYVRDAKVVEEPGGFALQVEFNREGRHLLEQYTSGNQTGRLVIFSHFISPADPKVEIDRWLGAPRISRAITNGMLVFSPDASREEADRVARSLRNTSKKLGTAKALE